MCYLLGVMRPRWCFDQRGGVVDDLCCQSQRQSKEKIRGWSEKKKIRGCSDWS